LGAFKQLAHRQRAHVDQIGQVGGNQRRERRFEVVGEFFHVFARVHVLVNAVRLGVVKFTRHGPHNALALLTEEAQVLAHLIDGLVA